MGASSALDPGQRLPPPDTPPDLVSSTASTYSSKSSPATEAAWNSRPLASPPMSDYERGSKAAMSGEKSAEAGPSQLATHGHASSSSRQQLPSLSSLFGPPSSLSHNSPMSDRNNSYFAASPMDRPRFTSNARTHADSYFPPTLSPPISQPRTSYDIKFDAERPPLNALRHSSSGSASPGFRALNHGRSESRSESETTNKWATHHDAGKGEYSLESRDAAYRASRDYFQLQFPGHKDASRSFSDHRPSTAAQNPPPTPGSTTTSEGVPSKDGLGPKIWTGTHFLPRFVRAAEVPGEGMCYFYDDGSHCKTVIDGEAVNAHWGVTKAGKPRKRLAIACVTCREKKIKCDPDYPRCVQCEKFGRVCKFKNAPRGGHNGSPSSPPAEFEDSRKARPNDYRHSQSNASSPMSPRTALPRATAEGASHKRIKLDHEAYTPNGEPSPAASRPLDHSKSQRASPLPPPEMPRIPDSVLDRAWKTDPFVTDPQSITAVIGQFFAHIGSTMILQFLPEQETKAWVSISAHQKSAEDLMLLYGILAVGVALSGGPKQISFEYAQVADYAQKTTEAESLQVAQSRILLAVYYISVSRRRDADRVMCAAGATAASLQLNLELEKTSQVFERGFPLGMNRAGYCESRRRTLWSLFMLERMNGTFPDRMTLVNHEDVYIRLPADQRSFERQAESRSPIFNSLELSLANLSDQPHDIAPYLVEMVHLWAESQSSVYKLVHRPASVEAESARVHGIIVAIEHWKSRLPGRLELGRSNLEEAASAGQVGSFVTMHLLYNHAMIKLNRHCRVPSQLSRETREDHIHKCHGHANEIVDAIDNVDRLLRARPMTLSVPPPIVAVAVTEAVDVLSTSQPLSRLTKVIESVRTMKPLVDTMGGVWEGSRDIRHAIDKRLHLLGRIGDQVSHSLGAVDEYRIISRPEDQKGESSAQWEVAVPLEQRYTRDMDIVYSRLN